MFLCQCEQQQWKKCLKKTDVPDDVTCRGCVTVQVIISTIFTQLFSNYSANNYHLCYCRGDVTPGSAPCEDVSCHTRRRLFSYHRTRAFRLLVHCCCHSSAPPKLLLTAPTRQNTAQTAQQQTTTTTKKKNHVKQGQTKEAGEEKKNR